MRLLITGGTGFIGSRLALAAQKDGMAVIIAGQANTEAERRRLLELDRHGVQVMQGPLQDPAYAQRIVDGCGLVIHLAAAQHEANVADSYFESVNEEGTRTLLQASQKAGVERFVYGSTIGVYGDAPDSALNESTPPRPVNAYGRTKLRAEGVVQSFVSGVQTSIVRISETYGPGDFRLLKLFKAIDRGRFFMIGSGLNRRQVIHVQDLVRMLLLATQHPAAVGQTFVAAGNEVMTTRDMVAAIARALGRSEPRARVPLWPFLGLAVSMEATLRPLGIQPPLHRRRLDFFRKSYVFDTAKARSLLGFVPEIAFHDGVLETANWYRQQGYLAT
jgi:nucleoside-diphosphate-sugar epimerase